MMVIGLTGGIGSGKSTVAHMFRDLGIPVYDSDNEAKRLMVSSPELKKAIMHLLGEEAYLDGKLNRGYIAEKVFGDPGTLQRLNSLVHPAVRLDFDRWVSAQTAPYVIQETALIFESGTENLYDRVILTTAPVQLRVDRVTKRDGSAKKEVMQRIKNQMGDGLKSKKANYSIDNIDLDTTRTQIQKLHNNLLKLVD